MLLVDKLIKWETGVGTEKGATLPQIINLFLLGFTPEENDLSHFVGTHGKRKRQGGEGGRKDGEMKGEGGNRRKHKVGCRAASVQSVGSKGGKARKSVGRGVQWV